MFRQETITGVTRDLSVAIDKYKAIIEKDPAAVKVCLSKGNSKIGKSMNFSIAPILTCGRRCKLCARYCYDIKACKQYPNNVIDARARNTAFAYVARDYLFNQIDAAMSRRRTNKTFRFHVAGDIIDLDYFSRMVDIAKKHPDFRVWTYTKQYEIVNEYCDKYGRNAIPNNFTIMFSEWKGAEMINPYSFPEFRVIFKGEKTPSDAKWICPGNCDICKQCNRGCLNNETTYAHEH